MQVDAEEYACEAEIVIPLDTPTLLMQEIAERVAVATMIRDTPGQQHTQMHMHIHPPPSPIFHTTPPLNTHTHHGALYGGPRVCHAECMSWRPVFVSGHVHLS